MFYFYVKFNRYKSLLIHGLRLLTGTTDTLLEVSILVAEGFGWTMFAVMVGKRTLRRVNTTAGAAMTVVTVRIFL